MARRRSSCRRRASNGRTRRWNDGVSFKSKGQADFTSNKQTVTENGNATERKENCDPEGVDASPLHRPNHLNSLINVNYGRDSACSDEAPVSSCSLYTSSCSTPSCDTPSLSSYGDSRTGTSSIHTPSIRTPSIRTPSLFGSSFDNSSFDASSLDYESNCSSLSGTPIISRKGPHLGELSRSSSQEESSEESRANKRSEKRRRYRRNKRLRMLAAMHMENLEKEKLCRMTSSAIKENEIAAATEKIIELPEETHNSLEKSVINKLTPTPSSTTLKERESVDEVVDEGFSENFDKAQRKNIEEASVNANDSSATDLLNNNNYRVRTGDKVDTEINCAVGYQVDPLLCGDSDDVISKYVDELPQTIKDEIVKKTSEFLEKRIKASGSINEVVMNDCNESKEDKSEENECDNDNTDHGTDDPPKENEQEELDDSFEVTEEEGTTSEGGSPATSASQSTRQSNTGGHDLSVKETEITALNSDEHDEKIENIICTKAIPDEVTSSVVNDNLHLLNPCDKLELVDVLEMKDQENVVVLEMKNHNENPSFENTLSIDQEKKIVENTNDLDTKKVKVRFAEEENEDGENVIDIPIVMETGYEEIFPEEQVELIDVLKAEEGEDGDIVIFEVQNDETKEDTEVIEDEENDGDTKEEVENERKDEMVSGKEVTDICNETNPKEEVQIAQNGSQATGLDKNVENFAGDEAKKPAEKVDAALAELDSIPDGVCESGEVEEEEEDEEEWSYYRMEPQNHPQGEDVLTSGAASADVPSKPAENIENVIEPVDMVNNEDIVPVEEPKAKTEDLLDNLQESGHQIEQTEENEIVEVDENPIFVGKTPDILENKMDVIPSLDDHPERLINFSGPGIEKNDLIDTGIEQNSPHGSGSPRAPGSPRSVEGFVTSVELNTADESFATNFAVNQSQDGFTGQMMDQTSGPFSVYVSSSPEPASLDPPSQSPVDLLNMANSMTNGQVDDEHFMNKTEVQESPVEIVHAQSTVEVVAPPSPVDVSGPETQFILPDMQVPDSTAVHMPPTDISFVPQPIIEPSAEVPVPVFVDDTPVSEPEVIPEVTEGVAVVEDMVTISKTEMQMETETVSNVESFVETTKTETSSMVTDFEELTLSSAVKEMASPDKFSDFETLPNTEDTNKESTSPMITDTVILSDEVTENNSQKVVSPEPLETMLPEPIETNSQEPSEVELPELAKLPETVEVEAVSPELAKLPETAEAKSPEPVKSKETVEAKPTKATKTPAKSAGDKTATKATPGKATPSKTPSKATPKSTPSTSRTPSTKTPTTRTPLAKSTEKKTPASKPASPAVASKTTSKPPSARPASTTTTKPTVPRTAAPKPAARSTAPVKPSTTTKSTATASKPTAKPAGTTAPRTGTTAPRTGTTTKPSTTRPSSTTTATRKPLGATKPADKTDGKLVNGTARPTSRPGTAKPATTTTTRRPVPSMTKTATKSAAEKETKNTTNQILSTRPAKAPSATSRTSVSKTSATHSTSRTSAKVSETANATKSRVTTATKTTASKTAGAATKKTLVSKSKTSQAGTKEASVKSKTEASVIDNAEPIVNGENKIADEETSVEVLEKCAVEDIMQASSEKIVTETMSSEMVVTSTTTEVLVNGDH